MMERDDAIKVLAGIVMTAQNNREKIAALDRLAKLLGWFKPLERSVESEEEDLLPGLRNLSEADLLKLAGEDDASTLV